MRLINNERVVAPQHGVALGLGQQNAIGHELDARPRREALVKTHLPTHDLAHLRLQLLRNAPRHRSRRQTPWLGMANQALLPTTRFKANFGQLRGLAGARFTAHDDDGVREQGVANFVASATDRQVFGILDGGKGFLHDCGHYNFGLTLTHPWVNLDPPEACPLTEACHLNFVRALLDPRFGCP